MYHTTVPYMYMYNYVCDLIIVAVLHVYCAIIYIIGILISVPLHVTFLACLQLYVHGSKGCICMLSVFVCVCALIRIR